MPTTGKPEYPQRIHRPHDGRADRVRSPAQVPQEHGLCRSDRLKIAAFLALYALSFILQGSLTSASRFSGVIAQFQVVISVFLVVNLPRPGRIVALGANGACLLILASRYFLLGDLPVLPGIFICLSTMIVVSIVSLYACRLNQRNGELARSRQEMSQLYEKVLLAEKTAAYQANHDELTGLPNARKLRAWLVEHYAAARSEPLGGLALVKVENLKGINSIFGSLVGDSVVQRIALRLRAYAEQHACQVARVQSGTFALFFARPAAIDTQLRQLFRSLELPAGEGEPSPNVHLCAGYAHCGNGADDAGALHQCAEFALTYSDTANYQPIRGYDADMAKAVRRHLTIIGELENALARGEFSLFYQPKIDSRSTRLIGAEALIRWTNGRLGDVAPGEFIPLAEQNRLILGVGRWVLGRACQDASGWPGAWTVSVNVSTAQFFDPTFEAQIDAALAGSGLAPSRLVVEITESVLIEDKAHVTGILERIRARNVAVSMDDFGTGFSSLAYLRNIPLDELKVDRSFVATLESDAKSRTIVDSIVHLADQLAIRTVAEGVETTGQACILRQLGCHSLQGYLYGRPMPVGELLSMAGENGESASSAEAPAACEAVLPVAG